MKTILFASSAAAIALAFALPAASPAAAAGQSRQVEVVKRSPGGRAEVVRIDGQEYTVCTENMQDGCINPREAGLRWGNEPLNYWPGRPASELHGHRAPHHAETGL